MGECAGVGNIIFSPGTRCNSKSKPDLLAIITNRRARAKSIVRNVIIQRPLQTLDKALLDNGTRAVSLGRCYEAGVIHETIATWVRAETRRERAFRSTLVAHGQCRRRQPHQRNTGNMSAVRRDKNYSSPAPASFAASNPGVRDHSAPPGASFTSTPAATNAARRPSALAKSLSAFAVARAASIRSI